MAVELAEVAAGLPMAASFALAGGITSLREGRRRSALNEAMHELRRPLQALSLALPTRLPDDLAVSSSLRLATAALDRLDSEINGSQPEADAHTPLAARPLLEESLTRWRAEAKSAGRELRLVWRAGEPTVRADRCELAQAVDNLISNALVHGGGKVGIEARASGNWLSISVRDGGPPARMPRPGAGRPSRGRHGHGLRVVARVARAHGGSFALRRHGRGTEAMLRLPLDRTVVPR
jgi:signal transduction histidine kinase